MSLLRISFHHVIGTVVGRNSFHVSSTNLGYARKGKRMRRINPIKEARMRLGPNWVEPPVVMKSPIYKSEHPQSRFQDEESQIEKIVEQASHQDRPIKCDEDPYKRESAKCILCPRRYEIPIRPDYKNPKLLAQFVSPHTGLVYKSHITGLCKFMQEEVEQETKKAQAMGYMSTKMKEIQYLKDPVLVDPTRPIKRNPY